MQHCNNYYIYRHIRPDKNEPFYIGIGKGRRWRYITGRNEIWNRVFHKNNGIILCEILMDNIDFSTAQKKEIEFIKMYGRIDLGTGTLANMTAGGEGANEMSPKSRMNISIKNTGKKRSDEFKSLRSLVRRGTKHTEETKEKIRAAQRGKLNHRYGKKESIESIEAKKIRSKGSGNPNYKGPICMLEIGTLREIKIFKETKELVDFFGMKPINVLTCVYSVISGRRSSAFGYVWAREGYKIEELPEKSKILSKGNRRMVLNKKTGETYPSIQIAGKTIGVNPITLGAQLSGHYPNKTDLVFKD